MFTTKMNNCDLEETRHMALRKCIELMNRPSKWTCNYVETDRGSFTLGNFDISCYTDYYSSTSKIIPVVTRLTLGKESLFTGCILDKDLLESYNELSSYWLTKKNEERCLKIKLDAEKSCKEIQKYLFKPWWKVWG